MKLTLRPDHSGWITDVVTRKVNSAGVVVWRNLYASSGGGNDFGRGVVVDRNRDVYVGISAQQGTQFNENYVLVKYSSGGGPPKYEKSFDGSGNDRDALFAVNIDQEGNIFLSGESQTDWASGRSVDFMTLKVTSTVSKSKIIPFPGR